MLSHFNLQHSEALIRRILYTFARSLLFNRVSLSSYVLDIVLLKIMNQDVDRHAPPSSLTPAPYGRACMDCSQSKCKCMIRKIDGRCER